MVYKSFDKKSSGSGVKSEILSDQQLADALHNPVIKKFEKRKVKRQYLRCWSCRYAIKKRV